MTVTAKICGLNDTAGLAAAIDGGAAMAGFLFYPPSPRAVSPMAAAALMAQLPGSVRSVAVLVDPDDGLLDTLVAATPAEILQLHGQESPERVAEIRARTGRRVMKAVKVKDAADLDAAAAFEPVADFLLFDAWPPGRDGALPGGNGEAFDWPLLAGRRFRLPWLLSGGLHAGNLAAAVATSGAAQVDVSSGVEIRPGVKDPARIRAFLAACAAL
ncbi:MAG: phosphoribosylanthranilate isomerase [Sneathiellaceae bacterium]